MSNCRPVVTPGEVISTVELPTEGNPEELDPDEIRMGQTSRFVDMAKYKNKTGHCIRTIENIIDGSESTE